MTEKQEHLLKLFQELDHICQENELRYVLAEESTLAAVGRAGFAGGETEIKVYMPRADWNRLGEIAGKELPKDRILYPEPMAGYGEDFGCALEKQQILGSGPAGERIHIRILDPVSEEAFEKYRRDLGIYLDLTDSQEVHGLSWGISPSRYYRYYLSGRLTGKRHVLGNPYIPIEHAFSLSFCFIFLVYCPAAAVVVTAALPEDDVVPVERTPLTATR